MLPDVTRDLTTAGRMADMNGFLQIQVLGKRREIAGVMVHVVSVGHLARAAMPAAIVRDDAKSLADKEQHLGIPVIS